MTGFIAVFLGGSIGASLRYLVSLIAQHYSWYYQGTFIVNILGCLFLGFVSYIAIKHEKTFHPDFKLFLTTGIAGGFTTFSTFSYEVFTFIQHNQLMAGIIYMLLSCTIGFAATLLGIYLAKQALSFVLKEPQFEEKI